MNIIVVGCGKVGEELASVLSQEDNDVTIIDKNEDVVNELCDRYDIMGTVGNGASYSVLKEADVEHADLVIAVSGSDEQNLLCCLSAKKGGSCHTIARIRNPEYNKEIPFLKEELGLAMVLNQEETVAREIARLMKFPSAIAIDTFAKGRMELLRFRIPEGSILDSLTLVEMHNKLRCAVLVCSVERDGDIVIPNGEFVLRSGDVISIVSEPTAEEIFFRKIGLQTNKIKDVMIVGGGDIGYYLSEMLLDYGIRVKLIEKNLKRCEQLSEMLPKASIIYGDGSDKALLMEEDLDGMGGFVALTDIDEENVILSLFARKSNVRKIVTKINRIAFDEVISSLDLDTTVHPRSLTAEYILQYVRGIKNSMGSNIETLHWIVDNKAEALEFNIQESFSMKGVPLHELKLRKGILVAGINRSGRIILPRGNDVLLPRDTVLVVTTITGLNDIEDIIEE